MKAEIFDTSIHINSNRFSVFAFPLYTGNTGILENVKINRKSWIISIVIMLLLVAFDQFTKQLALVCLGSGKTYDFGFLGLKLIFNSGAAFSLGASGTWIITVFALTVTFAIPYFMYRTGEAKYQYLLAIIWAGAIGNLIDRLFREPGFGNGHVVDFIRYGDLFIGNVADIALVIGVIALIIVLFRDDSKLSQENNETGCAKPEQNA